MRTFIAIPLPGELLHRLTEIQTLLRKGIRSGVAWVNPTSIHLTLKFLGEINEKQLPDVRMKLADCLKNTSKFQLTSGGIGCFPGITNPKVLWSGIQMNPNLEDIQFKIETTLSQIGFEKEERKFSPHLTLGRVKTGLLRPELEFLQKTIEQEAHHDPMIFVVNQVVLYKSDLTRSGAIYSAISINQLIENNR